MNTTLSTQSTAARSGKAVILLGLLLAITGLAIEDSLGASTSVAALGVALLVGGTTFVSVAAPTVYRYAFTIVALTAAPLVFFDGVTSLIGTLGIGTVVVGVLYTRLISNS